MGERSLGGKPKPRRLSSRTLASLTQGVRKVHVGVILRNPKRLIVSGRFELQAYNATSGDLPCDSVGCKEQSVLYVRVYMGRLGTTGRSYNQESPVVTRYQSTSSNDWVFRR